MHIFFLLVLPILLPLPFPSLLPLSLFPYRDVLQSTVVALQSAVTSSLQLTPIITSVLAGQQLQPGIASGGEAGGTGLPERLLAPIQPSQGEELTPPSTASKGEEEEGDSSAEEPTPTPTHSTSPHVQPVRFNTDWTTLKMVICKVDPWGRERACGRTCPFLSISCRLQVRTVVWPASRPALSAVKVSMLSSA